MQECIVMLFDDIDTDTILFICVSKDIKDILDSRFHVNSTFTDFIAFNPNYRATIYIVKYQLIKFFFKLLNNFEKHSPTGERGNC